MSSAKEIAWKARPHESSTLETSFLEQCTSISQLSDDRLNQFISKCHAAGDVTAIETILRPSEVRRKTNLRDEIFLASLYSDNSRNKTLSELIEKGKSISLNISKDEVEDISSLTIPRLKSKCSVALRRGRITGSNFESCCTSNIKDPNITLIRRIINITKCFGEVASIKNKKKAIKQYISNMEENHEEFVYKECGLLINSRFPYLAGSPNALVSCTCHREGCLKLKYLKSLISDESLERMTRKPNNILNKLGEQYTLEKSHEYFYQVQLQINLIEREYCDFVIWSQQKVIVIRVEAEIEFWSAAVEQALNFHEKIIMPELLGKFYTDITSSIEEEKEEFEEQLIALEIEILNSLCTTEENEKQHNELEIEVLNPLSNTEEREEHLIALEIEILDSLCTTEENEEQCNELEIEVLPDCDSSDILREIYNLESLSIAEICATFETYEQYLKDIFDNHIYQPVILFSKLNVFPNNNIFSQTLETELSTKGLAPFAAFELVSNKQFEAMLKIAEQKLVTEPEIQHNVLLYVMTKP